MEPREVTMYRGISDVRNYGVVVLIALLVLNGVTLWALHWVETNDIRNELVRYAETLPIPDATKTEQTFSLPEDILSFRTTANDRVGFYETKVGKQDYLAYADTNKHYVLMKSEEQVQLETRSFAIALVALYIGEVVLLVGWWFFIRTKVREIFETV